MFQADKCLQPLTQKWSKRSCIVSKFNFKDVVKNTVCVYSSFQNSVTCRKPQNE